MQNSFVVFTFSVFDQKHTFWANLVQKIKIVSLSWNLISRKIGIDRIQWCCSFFQFSTGSTFSGKFGPVNSNMQNSVVLFTFSGFEQQYLFCAHLLQKNKIVSLSWHLVPSIIGTWWVHWWCSLFLFSTWNTLLVQIWSNKSKLLV